MTKGKEYKLEDTNDGEEDKCAQRQSVKKVVKVSLEWTLTHFAQNNAPIPKCHVLKMHYCHQKRGIISWSTKMSIQGIFYNDCSSLQGFVIYSTK